jgi:CBS domain-containing protein
MANVRDVLAEKGGVVVTIDHESSVFEAAATMSERRIGALVVMRGETIAGIFTERDLMTRVVAARRDPAGTRVSEVMTTPIACCEPDTALEECRTVMTTYKLRHLPVVDDGRLPGIISSGDILARELRVQEETIKYLHDYVTGPN